jgi:hypothetical protein
VFEELDFLYTPSRDVGADAAYFTDVLGGRLVFAIASGEDRVAAVSLSERPPLILFADHLDGERPFLIYRVADLLATLLDLEGRGWTPEETFEIPHGPCCTFESPSGQRVGVYQLVRPDVAEHFEGRRDF